MPEPSMVLLFGAAAAGLVGRRRQGLKAKEAAAA
ncbi:PEP-CTERM sorting domain-containing protein [Novosphingobium sp.]